MLLSNQAINKLSGVANDWILGGVRDAYQAYTKGVMRKSQGSATGVKAAGAGFEMLDEGAHAATSQRVRLSAADALREGFRARDGELAISGYSAKRLAGTYIGASAAGRLLSGGGVYKDKDGSTDLIGLPLI